MQIEFYDQEESAYTSWVAVNRRGSHAAVADIHFDKSFAKTVFGSKRRSIVTLVDLERASAEEWFNLAFEVDRAAWSDSGDRFVAINERSLEYAIIVR